MEGTEISHIASAPHMHSFPPYQYPPSEGTFVTIYEPTQHTVKAPNLPYQTLLITYGTHKDYITVHFWLHFMGFNKYIATHIHYYGIIQCFHYSKIPLCSSIILKINGMEYNSLET